MTLQTNGPLRHSRIVCRRHDDFAILSLPKVEINKDVSTFVHSKMLLLTLNSLDSSHSYLPEVQRKMDLFRTLVPALVTCWSTQCLVVVCRSMEIIT